MRSSRHFQTHRLRRSIGVIACALLGLGLLQVPASAAPAPRVVGVFDHLTATPTGIRIEGWAALAAGGATPMAIAVTIDGRAQPAFLATVARADVAARHPAIGAAHGFTRSYELASGAHTVCVSAKTSVATAAATKLSCKQLRIAVAATGRFDSVRQAGGAAALVTGWGVDPDSAAPAVMTITVDRTKITRIHAIVTRADVHAVHPLFSARHGLSALVLVPLGVHTVCVSVAKVVSSASTALGCRIVTMTVNPRGVLNAIPRAAGSTSITISGWAADPELAGAITVLISIDGGAARRVSAGLNTPGLITGLASGSTHGFSLTVPASFAAHRVCATALNVGRGTNLALGCHVSPAMAAHRPSPPRGLVAKPTDHGVVLLWQTPSSDGGAPITSYVISSGSRLWRVRTQSIRILGLAPGVRYNFTVYASNAVGPSAQVGTSGVPNYSAFALVRAPTPKSTSRYIRNINGNAARDAAVARAMGLTDAHANAANHRHLILLQIGGQSDGLVGLSATSVYLTYGQVLLAMKNYVAGYAAYQQANAPVIIAIGANSDIEVSAATGRLWATALVNPLMAFAARYRNITIAGADDMEPGFSGSMAESQAWLRGFLAATSAKFVFNGSADGCSTGGANSRCNNGWTAAGLQYLAGGAAPTRILSLPQIYNYAMPAQWKFISLTGVVSGRPKINFAGPLTEWDACAPSYMTCDSIYYTDAWSHLWAQLQSDHRVAQLELPYATDLRIN